MKSENHEKTCEIQPATLDGLLARLLEMAEVEASNELKNEESKREALHAANLLAGLASAFQDWQGLDDNDVYEKIKANVLSCDHLISFSYYLSMNNDFHYLWSYFLKQRIGYIKYVHSFYIYLKKVVEYLNVLSPCLIKDCQLAVVFHSFLTVRYDNNAPKYSMEWNELKQVNSIGKDFYIEVLYKQDTLLCWSCRDKDNLSFENFKKVIEEMISKIIENRKEDQHEQ